jgi:hypothetical protein
MPSSSCFGQEVKGLIVFQYTVIVICIRKVLLDCYDIYLLVK